MFHDTCDFLLRSTNLQGIQLVFEVSIGDETIPIFVKLFENLKDLNWALEYFLFQVLKDFFHSMVVNRVFIDFIKIQITINISWWRISSSPVIQFFGHIVLISEHQRCYVVGISATIGIVDESW